VFEALSGIGAASAAFLVALSMYLEYRRRMFARAPIIEPIAVWTLVPNGPAVVTWDAIIRNQLPETLDIQEVEVLTPRGCAVSAPLYPFTAPAPFTPWPQSRTIKVKQSLAPKNTTTATGGEDTDRMVLKLQPPPGWLGGKIVVRITASSRGRAMASNRFKATATLSST
jgi:hypothetical protein